MERTRKGRRKGDELGRSFPTFSFLRTASTREADTERNGPKEGGKKWEQKGSRTHGCKRMEKREKVGDGREGGAQAAFSTQSPLAGTSSLTTASVLLNNR